MFLVSHADLVLLGIASGIVSLTLTRSYLTKRLRQACLKTGPAWLGEQVNCPFCMAFWTSTMVTPYDTGNIQLGLIIVTWMSITGLACLFMGILLKLWLFREAELEDMRDLLRKAQDRISEVEEYHAS